MGRNSASAIQHELTSTITDISLEIEAPSLSGPDLKALPNEDPTRVVRSDSEEHVELLRDPRRNIGSGRDRYQYERSLKRVSRARKDRRRSPQMSVSVDRRKRSSSSLKLWLLVFVAASAYSMHLFIEREIERIARVEAARMQAATAPVESVRVRPTPVSAPAVSPVSVIRRRR